MIVAFASNQVMFGKGTGSGGGTVQEITTDPVPMNGMNRASMILNVHSYLDPSSAQDPALAAECEVSNDGVTWVKDGPELTGVNATGPQAIATADAEGQFIRFKFSWNPEVNNGADYVFICFDLHVRLDHT